MKSLVMISSLFMLWGCRDQSVNLLPGVGMEGCALGMDKNAISEESKNLINGHLL